MPARQTYLIVETHAIARPLIDALGLARCDELPKLRCYASATTLLAESRAQAAGGSPSVAAAVTTSYLLGRAGHDPATRLFHVGSCQARPAAAPVPVGGLVLANRVVDGHTGRVYYPDILLAHELLESAIETLTGGEAPEGGGGSPPGEVGSGGSGDRARLVDRELAGFLAAALTFLAPHQVYCLAAVTAPGGEDAGAHVEASMGAIRRLIEQAALLLRPAAAGLSDAVRRSIEALAVEMRLTAAQTAQLRALAEGAAARGLDVGAIAGRGRLPVRTKQERNRGFDELKRLFRQ